jgi:hypothetical protein
MGLVEFVWEIELGWFKRVLSQMMEIILKVKYILCVFICFVI